MVVELKSRIPYLEVLHHLSNAAGVLAIGSTEEHYTASKIFQSLLSGKKIFPVFHYKSTVVEILNKSNAAHYLVTYNPDEAENEFDKKMQTAFSAFLSGDKPWHPDLSQIEDFSAKKATEKLVSVLNQVIKR